MKLRNKMVLPAVTLLAFATSSIAFGATQGSLDGLANGSTGSSDISIEVLDAVKITDMDDVDFGTYGADDTGAMNQGDAFCVYVNGGDAYSIVASNPNGSAFTLIGDTFADTLEYTVALDEDADASDATVVATHGQAQDFVSGSVKVDCDSVNNTSFDIRITEQELRDMTTDTYAGTLQLLLKPI
ncbi:MAG: hypothetical protein ACJAYE_002155 [Candidatus Azotimanducaceae bacterium]|jgi:hypothetical protein